MKVYKKIVLDIANFDVLEEESYEYDGSVAECKSGGGGGDVTSVDPVYNDRMASISEEQLAMGREYYNWYKYGEGETRTVTRPQSSLIYYSGQQWTQFGSDTQYYDANGNPTGVYLDQANARFVDSSGSTIATYSGDIYAAHASGSLAHSGASITTVDGKTFGQVTAFAPTETTEYVTDPDAGPSYRDWESAQISANMELLPGETALSAAQTNAALTLLPSETELAKAEIAYKTGEAELATEALPWKRQLMMEQMMTEQSKAQYERGVADLGKEALPWRRELMMDEMYNAHQTMQGQKELIPEYYKLIAEGVDVEDEMAKAKTDVMQAASGAEGQMRREMGRMGIDPTSGRYQSLRGAQLRETAADVAGAGTAARRYAEEKQFERVKAGATAPTSKLSYTPGG